MRYLTAPTFVLLAGLAAFACFAWWSQAPNLSQDSYQYLDAARSVASGHCLCTHVALYDEQVVNGHMPVPLTHFPPGYPLLIAGLMKVGIPPVTAGFLLSMGGFLVSLWLIWDIGLMLGAQQWAIAAISLLWVANFSVLWDATSVLTESLFTATLLGMASLLVHDIRSAGEQPGRLLLLGFLAGAAYDIRYAGLLMLPAIGLYFLWRWRQTPAARSSAARGVFIALLLIVPVMVHNLRYSGSWRGGFPSTTHRSLVEIIDLSAKAYYNIVFGNALSAHAGLWGAVFCGSLALLLLLVARSAWLRGHSARLTADVRTAVIWVVFVAATYLGGVIVSGLVSVNVGDITRYNRPVYPLALALAAPLLSMGITRRWIPAGLAVLAAIVIINGRALIAGPPRSPDAVAASLLHHDIQPGTSAAAWLRSRVSGGVLFAVYGQGVHYVLDRDVVAFLFPPATVRPLDAESYREEMVQFHAHYILVFPGLPAAAVPEQEQVPFLRNLASGTVVPSWLREDVRNSEIAIYECSACSSN